MVVSRCHNEQYSGEIKQNFSDARRELKEASDILDAFYDKLKQSRVRMERLILQLKQPENTKLH